MKVLIISHNPIRTNHNMGQTMLSLFSAVKREELCQLYIYPTLPNTESCNSYYRITDKDVLCSYWRFRVQGKPVACVKDFSGIYENAGDEALYSNPKNHAPFRSIARDIMWKGAHWFNKDLRAWLDAEKPTVIFVAPGLSKFLYDIAQRISKWKKIPIVTYICDDYYFVAPEKSLLGKLQQSMLKNKIRGLMGKTNHLIAICDEIKGLYSETFSLPATTLMTGSNVRPVTKDGGGASAVVSYFGNIGIGRDWSIAAVGRCLDSINQKQGTNYQLKIYTAQKNVQSFDGIQSVQLCGFLTGKAYEEAFEASDYLLHVEGFEDGQIDLVKNSVSTKISDSLASGIPLIAFAPQQVASMGHLLRNDCAFAVTDPQMLEVTLLRAFTDTAERKRVVSNALMTAEKYHNEAQNSRKLREILLSAERNNPHE